MPLQLKEKPRPLQLKEKPRPRPLQLRLKPPLTPVMPPLRPMLVPVAMLVAMANEESESERRYSLWLKITKRQFFTECDSG